MIGTFEDVTDTIRMGQPRKPAEFIKLWMSRGCTRKEAKQGYNSIQNAKVYQSEYYIVHVEKKEEGWIHLSIRNADGSSRHDWRDFQEIKNTLVGRENEGIELYPAESRMLDECNQFHLWVREDPEDKVPVGRDLGRRVSNKPDAPNTFQRGSDDIERMADSQGKVVTNNKIKEKS